MLFESSGRDVEDKGDAEVVNEEKMSQAGRRETKERGVEKGAPLYKEF